jgi:DNA-binding MarR family transcriptional regulator
MLCESGPLPVSEIGKRLLISKPQMTPLIDRLIAQGLVERTPNTRDRRVIMISVTDGGRKKLDECRAQIANNLGRKLAALSEQELGELSAALAKLVEIGSKVE